jgi:hypothetical protein
MIRRVIVLASFFLLAPVVSNAQTADIIVEKKTFEMPSYTTVAGETIKSVKIGWEAAGTLNADKSNAILITQYFSGTSHAFGKYAPTDKAAGYWDVRELVNPNLHDIPANLPFRVELWDRHDQHIRWVIAASSSVAIGHAALDTAIANYPDQRFTLRNGIQVIRQHQPGVMSRR